MTNKLTNELNRMFMNKEYNLTKQNPNGYKVKWIKINQYGNILKNYSESRNRIADMPEFRLSSLNERENTIGNEAKIIFKHTSAKCCPAV